VANQDREAPARERARPGRAAGRGRSSGDVDRVRDDLWSPYGPEWLVGRGARPGRRAGREPAHGQQARGRAAPSLSRAEIVDAAIAVADAEGADAVSMRRIAQVLRSGTMSLYWHVTNKEHLLDLMLDVLITEVEVPEPSGDWRADLRALAHNHRAMLLRHRWVMDFVGGRPPLGPNTLLNLDRSLALLDGFGLGIPTAVYVLATLQTYVMGAALREIREMRVQHDQEQARVDPADWESARAAWRDRLAADGRFTHVVRFLDAGFDPDAEETRDERFEFGLDCLLDGIAARVPALSASTSE
jgi:AcrR family transcriptional regulator